MNNESAQYLTIEDFAKIKGVPVMAVEVAIKHHKLSCRTDIIAGQKVIASEQLDVHTFELISVYDYADRRNVSYRGAYKKIEAGIIEPSDFTGIIGAKVDWHIFKDVYFRPFTARLRSNKSV